MVWIRTGWSGQKIGDAQESVVFILRVIQCLWKHWRCDKGCLRVPRDHAARSVADNSGEKDTQRLQGGSNVWSEHTGKCQCWPVRKGKGQLENANMWAKNRKIGSFPLCIRYSSCKHSGPLDVWFLSEQLRDAWLFSCYVCIPIVHAQKKWKLLVFGITYLPWKGRKTQWNLGLPQSWG